MQFSLKVQCIPDRLSENKIYRPGHGIALATEVTPPNEKFIERKGHLFIVLNITASDNFDVKTAIPLFIDNIKENYYRIDDETPLHSIEHALKKSLNIISSLKSTKGNISVDETNHRLNISFCACIIWNRVLYTSYYGNAKAYLIRGSGSRDLTNNNAYNEIWTNSNLLLTDDVIIIGSESFAKKFPANDIINSLGNLSYNIEKDPENSDLAAILIKVGQIKKQTKSLSFKHLAVGKLNHLNSFYGLRDSLHEKFKKYQIKKAAPVSSINSLLIQNKDKTLLTSKRDYKILKKYRPSTAAKAKLFLIMLLIGILYGNFRLIVNLKKQSIPNDIVVQLSPKATPSVQGLFELKEELSLVSPNTKLIFDTKERLGDPKITGISNFNFNKLNLINYKDNTIVSLDLNNNDVTKVLDVDKRDNPEFVACANLFCFLIGDQKIYVFSPTKPNQSDQYVIDSLSIIDAKAYGSALYLLTREDIYKFEIKSKTENPKLEKWTKNGLKITNPSSIAADGSIYVLTNDPVNRNIYKFRNGELDSKFAIDNNSYLLEPISITANDVYLFILDAKRKSVVMYDKITGKYIDNKEIFNKNAQVTPSFLTVRDKIADSVLIFADQKVYLVE